MNINKRGLVSSGGGSMGAWGGGLSKALHKKNVYDCYVGTSTGCLLQTLSSINEFDKLKEAYTKIQTSDIFKTNPFNKKNKENFLVILSSLIKNKTHFGDSTPFLKTIKKFFSENDYKRILETKKDMFAATTDLSRCVIEYKSIKDHKYEDFADWIYASSCVYPYMNPMIKNDGFYVDGGFLEHIPIQKAIEESCNIIDVIVHRPKSYDVVKMEIDNVLDGFKAILKTMHREISNDDILISKLKANKMGKGDVEINFYYTPYKLTENSLIFDEKQMGLWWGLGESFFDSKGFDVCCQTIKL